MSCFPWKLFVLCASFHSTLSAFVSPDLGPTSYSRELLDVIETYLFGTVSRNPYALPWTLEMFKSALLELQRPLTTVELVYLQTAYTVHRVEHLTLLLGGVSCYASMDDFDLAHEGFVDLMNRHIYAFLRAGDLQWMDQRHPIRRMERNLVNRVMQMVSTVLEFPFSGQGDEAEFKSLLSSLREVVMAFAVSGLDLPSFEFVASSIRSQVEYGLLGERKSFLWANSVDAIQIFNHEIGAIEGLVKARRSGADSNIARTIINPAEPASGNYQQYSTDYQQYSTDYQQYGTDFEQYSTGYGTGYQENTPTPRSTVPTLRSTVPSSGSTVPTPGSIVPSPTFFGNTGVVSPAFSASVPRSQQAEVPMTNPIRTASQPGSYPGDNMAVMAGNIALGRASFRPDGQYSKRVEYWTDGREVGSDQDARSIHSRSDQHLSANGLDQPYGLRQPEQQSYGQVLASSGFQTTSYFFPADQAMTPMDDATSNLGMYFLLSGSYSSRATAQKILLDAKTLYPVVTPEERQTIIYLDSAWWYSQILARTEKIVSNSASLSEEGLAEFLQESNALKNQLHKIIHIQGKRSSTFNTQFLSENSPWLYGLVARLGYNIRSTALGIVQMMMMPQNPLALDTSSALNLVVQLANLANRFGTVESANVQSFLKTAHSIQSGMKHL